MQMEQADEPSQKPQVAKYVVQNATQPICPLEYMPRLLIERSILKSRMNREVHVRFCEEQGVKFPLLTRLAGRVIFRERPIGSTLLMFNVDVAARVRWDCKLFGQVIL